MRRLGPAVPRRRLDAVGRPAAPGPPARPRGHRRARRQVHRPARRLPVGHRGAARRRLRQRRPRQRSSWVTSDDCETAEGAARAARRRRRGLRPRRLRRPRHRGQARRDHATPARTRSRCSASASACSAWSSRPPATWPASRTPTPPSSTPAPPHPVISTMAEQRRHRRRRAATWAARCAWASTRPSSPRARSSREVYGGQPYVEERHRHRYEVNNAYRAELEKKAGLVFSGTSPDGQPRRVRRAARARSTRTSSAPRRTPSCAPGRPGPPALPRPHRRGDGAPVREARLASRAGQIATAPNAGATRGTGRPRRRPGPARRWHTMNSRTTAVGSAIPATRTNGRARAG